MEGTEITKTDKDCIVSTANKVVTLVVMDRQEYIKSKGHLKDINTYRPIQTDLSNKHKNRLINILKNMKAEFGMSENTYNMMYPTGSCVPKF